ncbi:hypothetical protein FOXYS1_9314, partial [Fusarium oxysporum]
MAVLNLVTLALALSSPAMARPRPQFGNGGDAQTPGAGLGGALPTVLPSGGSGLIPSGLPSLGGGNGDAIPTPGSGFNLPGSGSGNDAPATTPGTGGGF